jgi:type II secretory pathway pseudopilin PulG
LNAARRRRRAGVTLFEVMVSAVIVSLLALVLMAANVPVSRASSEVGVAFDLDRTAGRFLAEVRREVRQSGYSGADLQLTCSNGIDGGPSTLGPFRRRLSFGEVADDSRESNWSRQITYALAPSRLGAYADKVPRYRVTRSQAGATSDVLEHVEALSVQQVPGSDTVSLALTLRRENPGWSGTGPGRFLARTYHEEIEFLNKQE